MKAKKVRNEHGRRHVTPAGRSVFYDLFPKAEADELVMRSKLLMGLEHCLKESGLTQTQAAKALGITQARVSDIKRGKIGQFSLDMLVRLASRAGLKPRVELAAYGGRVPPMPSEERDSAHCEAAARTHNRERRRFAGGQVAHLLGKRDQGL